MIVTVPRGDLIQIGIFSAQIACFELISSSFTGKSQFSCVSVHFEIKDAIATMCFCDWNGTVLTEIYYLAKK